jgi:hypothetical protein
MSKSAKSEGRREAADRGQLWLRLPGLVWEALYETVIGAGLGCVDEVAGSGACGAMRSTLRASGRSPGAARGTRGEFAGAGRTAGRVEPATGT